jgi:hypothetical protein
MIRESELFAAKGHRLVSATHATTLEVTKEGHLTSRGTCIVAVRSEKGASDLSPAFKELAKDPEATIILNLECNGVEDVVRGRGSQFLTFTHPTDMVFRRSDFTCDRTLAIHSDKSAFLLKRSLIKELRKELPVRVLLEVRLHMA